MRKILSFSVFGIPVVGFVAGGFLLLVTMFMWFAAVFRDTWQPLMGVTEADVDGESLGLWYPAGILLTVIQAIGVAVLLRWRGWPTPLRATTTVAAAATLLGATVYSYDLVILPAHSWTLFLINASGLVVAWTLCALTITLLRIEPRATQP
ncbi:DUF1761 family protein [Nocardia crassostreae]|uniref:DUF1761 family protein n=1 Tax=Nocardia crassostreae TaxID=53428 RepID=UPI000835A743|nr:DUF1761 family protein [Nocardia crassostreae]